MHSFKVIKGDCFSNAADVVTEDCYWLQDKTPLITYDAADRVEGEGLNARRLYLTIGAVFTIPVHSDLTHLSERMKEDLAEDLARAFNDMHNGYLAEIDSQIVPMSTKTALETLLGG